MNSKILKILAQLSYYPRIVLDFILFLLIKNDYSILDKFNNQDCLIVGNGPSIKKTPLDKIKMLSIGMNKINLLFDKTTWRPDLIVCVNGLVIKQNKSFFNITEVPLILPIKALYLGIKKRPNVIFLKISNTTNFNYDITKYLGKGSTVAYTCLQVAAFANVKSINLVGIDHNFEFKGKNNEIQKYLGEDTNHFDPNYFKDKMWGLPDLEGSELNYIKAKKYFDSEDKIIIDYTLNGKLNIFKKGELKDLIIK